MLTTKMMSHYFGTTKIVSHYFGHKGCKIAVKTIPPKKKYESLFWNNKMMNHYYVDNENDE